jgi:alkanesulfonate monooxygenase SsuD/methylene tetrahydromethanopterin reductase-like flavin-dependent oxidoreductase (luciferase family)
MQKLTRDDLYSLEDYAQVRSDFRAKVMAHKKNRQVSIGAHATLYFEDRLTMQYQVQEMLRVERIFERAGIEEELGAYNPLIPDGSNWKATFMIEYDNEDERRDALAKLIGIEDKLWVRVGTQSQVWAIADEDLERTAAEKTSSVHFVRFELTPEMVAEAKAGAAIEMGIDHQEYRYETVLEPPARASLTADLG